MSILNLGLQSVGLMRSKMNDQSEKLLSKCNTMNEIRKITEENPTLKKDITESLQDLIHLVSNVFKRQFLKDEPFETFTAALETKWNDSGKTIQLLGNDSACG